MIFVLLCILVPLQAAHVRVHTCVYICAHLAFAVLGIPGARARLCGGRDGAVSIAQEAPAGACLLSSCLYETVYGGD